LFATQTPLCYSPFFVFLFLAWGFAKQTQQTKKENKNKKRQQINPKKPQFPEGETKEQNINPIKQLTKFQRNKCIY